MGQGDVAVCAEWNDQFSPHAIAERAELDLLSQVHRALRAYGYVQRSGHGALQESSTSDEVRVQVIGFMHKARLKPASTQLRRQSIRFVNGADALRCNAFAA